MVRKIIIAAFGIATFMLGIVIRLSANKLSWPISYGYSGERANTPWAIMENSYIDVSHFIMALGICLTIASALGILFSDSHRGDRKPREADKWVV